LYLLGVRNLIIELDARYIKGMLKNPDISPSASINRWILTILTFHFTLVHVKGERHGPDGLSRRPLQPGDPPEDADEDFEDWIDNLHGFAHMIQPFPRYANAPPTVSVFTGVQIRSEEERNTDTVDQIIDLEDDDYEQIPRSENAKRDDLKIEAVYKWLDDLERPPDLSDTSFTKFVHYAMHFFRDGRRLWRKNRQGAHKLVLFPDRRLPILRYCHDSIGHKRFFATRSIISERFWWPYMNADIHWFLQTCHICQTSQTRKVLIPPVVAMPAPLFAKMYADTMHLPASNGFKYIVQGRCSLIHFPEFRPLRQETGATVGRWIYEDVLCRWGGLREIVTDNGGPFLKALEWLAKKYHIYHIRISGYNSRANGLVEKPHFDVRQALYKAADGVEKQWSSVVYSVFWSERITTRKIMGCSPYFAATGTHPLIPLDISEATYLQPAPDSILSTTDLIARRAIALQKRASDLEKLHSSVFNTRRRAALKFERIHLRTIRDYDFKRGNLVLMRNTKIEKSLNRKMRPRYLGPLVVVSRNRRGAYIVCELDGSVYHRPIAAFRLIPYFPRKSIPLPDTALDIDTQRLRELEASDDVDFDNDEVLDDLEDPEGSDDDDD